MAKSAPRLGKGLRAIVGPRAAAPFHHRSSASSGPPQGEPSRGGGPAAPALRQIPLDQIRPNPHQPRSALDQAALDQLAASVRRSGVLQPILLRRTADGTYELVAGERRWRAAQLAGLETVPAILREFSDAQAFEAALVENLQREDLGPLERATAYQHFIDTFGVTADTLAARLGQSRPSISNYLRLLSLSEEVRRLVSSGELGMGQARALAGITDPQRQLAVARLAVRRNLSVRQVEALAKEAARSRPKITQPSRIADVHLSDVEQTLSKALGLSVKLHPGKKKNSGRVIIRYNSLEEFDRIAEKIGGRPLLE